MSRWLAVSTASTARRLDEDTSTIPIMSGSNGSGALSCDSRSLSSSTRSQQRDPGEVNITHTIGNPQARDQAPYRSSSESPLLYLRARGQPSLPPYSIDQLSATVQQMCWFKGVTIYVAVGNGSLVGTTSSID